MTTTEVPAEIVRVDIDGRRRVVLVPSAAVTLSGASAEVKGLLHVVVTFAGESTVHYYTILVESWTAEADADEIKQKVGRVLEKAKEKAKEYARAIWAVRELGAEISFKDGVANRSWLPTWLQRYLE